MCTSLCIFPLVSYSATVEVLSVVMVRNPGGEGQGVSLDDNKPLDLMSILLKDFN